MDFYLRKSQIRSQCPISIISISIRFPLQSLLSIHRSLRRFQAFLVGQPPTSSPDSTGSFSILKHSHNLCWLGLPIISFRVDTTYRSTLSFRYLNSYLESRLTSHDSSSGLWTSHAPLPEISFLENPLTLAFRFFRSSWLSAPDH